MERALTEADDGFDAVVVAPDDGTVGGDLAAQDAQGPDGVKRQSCAKCADHGKMPCNCTKVWINNTRVARVQSIDTIDQTLALPDNFDAASNLFLGRGLVSTFGFLDDRVMEAKARKIMVRPNLDLRTVNVPVSARGGPAAVSRHRAGGLF